MAVALMVFAVAIWARRVTGSWLAPGAFFALYWSAQSILPILALPEDRVAVSAVTWVLVSALMVFAGDALGNEIAQRRPPSVRGLVPINVGILRSAYFVSIVLGAGASIVAIFDGGFDLSVFQSTGALVDAARFYSEGRYSGEYASPLLTQALLVFVYLSPLLGGTLAALSGRMKLRFVSGAMVPALLMTITQTQRAVTFVAVVLALGAFLTTSQYVGHQTRLTRRHVLVGVISVGLLLTLSVGAGLARLGSTDLDRIAPEVVPKVYDGLFGHMAVFSAYFESRANDAPTLGLYTFAGPFSALGLGDRIPGLYSESILLTSGEQSNLFTFFRPLIDDFTMVGGLVLLFTFGLLSGVAHRRVKQGNARAIAVLGAFYATVLYGFVTSIWIYNSIIAAILIFHLLIRGRLLFRHRNLRRKAHLSPDQIHSREGIQEISSRPSVP